MIVLGVDPGLTTGVAVYDTLRERVVEHAELDDPLQLGHYLKDWDYRRAWDRMQVVVENYVGGGPRTKEATHTLQVLGFVRYYAEMLGPPVVVQAPQKRLPYVAKAAELVDGKHAQAALAHCLAFAATLPKS